MLEQAADVVATHLAQQRVAVLVVEQRRIVVPQALVGVHARAVVAEQRLGHERRRVAIAVADVLDDVLVLEHLVGHLDQRAEAHVDLGLASRADLVVVDFDLDPGLLHLQDDLAAQVLQLVHRRDREVALLVARAIAEVGRAVATAIPDAFVRVDLIEALAGVLAEADRVEDVELDLGAEVGGRGDAALRDEGFSFFRDVPRVARIALHRARLDDVADDAQRRDGAGRVEEGGIGSGSSSMSDSLIFWKPRMDEPSKPMPSVKRLSENSSTGMEKCCHRPGRSMNLKSTILTCRSLACCRTSFGDVRGSAIFGEVAMTIPTLLLKLVLTSSAGTTATPQCAPS